MKTKFYVSALLLILFGIIVSGQETKEKWVEERTNEVIKKNNKIVSDETFRELAFKDFANIQTGDKNKNAPGRYAALDVNSKDKSFAFSPFMQRLGNLFFSADITGTLSNEGEYFDWKNRNTIVVGLNATWLLSPIKNFKTKPSEDDYKAMYGGIYDKVEGEITNKDSAKTKLKLDDITLNTKVYYNEKDSLAKYVQKYETLLAEKLWTGKTLFWVKFNVNPIAQDNFYYTIKGDTASLKNPYKETINLFSVQTSFNAYRETKNVLLYGNLYLKGTRKHNLSEINQTSQWNKIRSLTNETYISESAKNVYELDNNKFYNLFLFDYGLQGIIIYKKFNIGLELKYDYVKFIKPNTTNDVSNIDNFSAGIVLPFKDKTGAPSINIIPFYQYRQYIGYEKTSENIVGVKFSLPFGN